MCFQYFDEVALLFFFSRLQSLLHLRPLFFLPLERWNYYPSEEDYLNPCTLLSTVGKRLPVTQTVTQAPSASKAVAIPVKWSFHPNRKARLLPPFKAPLCLEFLYIQRFCLRPQTSDPDGRGYEFWLRFCGLPSAQCPLKCFALYEL